MDQIGRLRPARQSTTHRPTRMCVGCRQRDDRSALLRVVAELREDGRMVVVVDLRARRPGRGAWLHPEAACVDLALRRRALVRALRVQAALDVEALTAWVRAQRQ